MKTRMLTIITLVAGMLYIQGALYANGLVIPHLRSSARPPHHASYIPPRPVNVKYDIIKVRIDGSIATTEVEEVFSNPGPRPVEVRYHFPLPVGAQVEKFSMWIGPKEIEGKMLEAKEARTIYEGIVRKLKDPALMQFAGNKTYRTSVYPIPARGERKVRFLYREILKSEGGLYRYSYVSGTGDMFAKPYGEFLISVQVHLDKPLGTIYSPTHEVTIERTSETDATVRFLRKNYRPQRDFVLYYGPRDRDMGMNLICHKPEGEDGFFVLLGTPPAAIDEKKVMPKDVVFVFDTSGSMAGPMIKQARKALHYCMESLNKNDRFSIIAYSTRVVPFSKELVPAVEAQKKEARKFIDKFQATGGTNISKAFEKAFEVLSKSDRRGIIVFLTDGIPTVGETDITRLIEGTKRRNVLVHQIFGFGVGYEVNTLLIDKIAEDSAATSSYVLPEENIELKVSSFFRKVKSPYLKDVTIDFGMANVHSVHPLKIPGLFAGGEIVVFGRYQKAGKVKITIKGKGQEGVREFVSNGTFPEKQLNNEFVASIWAARKIGYLSDQVRLNGPKKELVDEIIRLSQKYGIITEYTSFLVEVGPNLTAEQMRTRVIYNINLANKSRTGTWAVAQNLNGFRQRNAMQMDRNEFNDRSNKVRRYTQVMNFGTRAFFNKGGTWVDASAGDAKDARVVKYFSDEYFKLLRENDGVAKFQRSGKDMVIRMGKENILLKR